MTLEQQVERLNSGKSYPVTEFTGLIWDPQKFFESWRKDKNEVYFGATLHQEIVNFSHAYTRYWVQGLIDKYCPVIRFLHARTKYLKRDRDKWKKKYMELLNMSLSEISGKNE